MSGEIVVYLISVILGVVLGLYIAIKQNRFKQ
jgi:uncharacterized protein YneF (UPF0154 family)